MVSGWSAEIGYQAVVRPYVVSVPNSTVTWPEHPLPTVYCATIGFCVAETDVCRMAGRSDEEFPQAPRTADAESVATRTTRFVFFRTPTAGGGAESSGVQTEQQRRIQSPNYFISARQRAPATSITSIATEKHCVESAEETQQRSPLLSKQPAGSIL